METSAEGLTLQRLRIPQWPSSRLSEPGFDRLPLILLAVDVRINTKAHPCFGTPFRASHCCQNAGKIVLCQNNIRNQAHMSRVVTHELIHAFDHCRAHVHWFTDIRHLACSEIRAASLSGDCSLVNEIFRLHFGLKQHHQTCVRDRAVLSILAVRNISREEAQKAVDDVFESCFNDREPFGRIPHTKMYAQYAHRDFQNRQRYYSNI
ncbi:mitochondrial inner membrane protease ATP23 homolog isoform X2 [Cricetulus griseus]|uniref:mitochondrial inner membrane protease ATP23 homolog isoform X2 n=1 Tax=Cricetulus griseus TaxID=10029 RepID=UPI0007DAA5C7|nr:mitochondrial inner membrane protease ATP23 homolog isoform X2 [Cricetulus griseus]